MQIESSDEFLKWSSNPKIATLFQSLKDNGCAVALRTVDCDLSALNIAASAPFQPTAAAPPTANSIPLQAKGNSNDEEPAAVASNAQVATSNLTMGGYDTKSKELLVCSNLPRKLLELTVIHELIHAYDDCRGRLSPSSSHQDHFDTSAYRKSIACSEIRAARLSGDCELLEEIKRGRLPPLNPFKLKDHLASCVRRRAILSMNMNPLCPDDPELNEATVLQEWDSCFVDTQPFFDQ